MNAMKGGAGATLIAVFMAATFAGGVSLAGLTSTFTNAFDGINFQSDVQFLENFIAPNVKAACQTDATLAKFPAETNMSKQLGSVDAMRIKQKNTLFGAGDKYLNLQVKTQGSKKSVNLDTNGWLGEWQCEGAGNNRDKIRINYTNYTASPPSSGTLKRPGNSGNQNWLHIPPGSIQHFRILEYNTDGNNETEELMIQVLITDG